MRGIVIYDTSYENTKIIAETIAETLKESGLDVHLSHVKDVKELHARDYDFLVLGSPTRINNMIFTVSRFISGKIKGEEWKDKPLHHLTPNYQTLSRRAVQVPQKKLQKSFLGKD
jgi:menaquinone-dependent protoporphyrinogen IX oxidase